MAAASRIATGGSCQIYVEPFDGFGGPADLDDGTFHVAWCLNGAAIASSSFCPSGGALRLGSADADPVIRVDGGEAGCTAITLEFDYSQFAATGTVLRYAVFDSPGPACAAAIGQVAAALDATGGQCTAATHTVDVASGQSVLWKIDHGSPGSNALFIDNVRITVTGCCDATGHDCCEEGKAGCADALVRECVCAVDPYCCDVAWDAQCVAEVTDLGCGECGAGAACLGDLAVDFGPAYAAGAVCELIPEVFETCEGDPPRLTVSGACGGPGDAAMTFAPGFPYSAAVTRCLLLPADAPSVLEFSYTKPTGTLGPRIDVSAGGAAFETVWQAPVVFAGGCAAGSVDLGGLAGTEIRLRFASGSTVSAGAAFDDIALTTPRPAADCCTPGPAGCVDAAVEACVCAIDPFCCEQAWDDLCVIGVEFYGCGDCGFCVDALETGFGAAPVAGTVCDAMPGLFVLCEGSPATSTGGACGGAGDAVLALGGGSATLRCLDLSDPAPAALEFSYAKSDGDAGPFVDVSEDAGATWTTAWQAARAPGPGCHAACVDLAAFAGRPFVLARFTAGAAAQTIDDVRLTPRSTCPRPADLTGEGVVDFADVLVLLAAWGPCPPPPACPADLDGDGSVGFSDLMMLFAAWS